MKFIRYKSLLGKESTGIASYLISTKESKDFGQRTRRIGVEELTNKLRAQQVENEFLKNLYSSFLSIEEKKSTIQSNSSLSIQKQCELRFVLFYLLLQACSRTVKSIAYHESH